MNTPILRIFNEQTKRFEDIPAIKGSTPVKGTDYYTDEERESLKNEILAEVPGQDLSAYAKTVDVIIKDEKVLTDAKAFTTTEISKIPTPDVSGQIGTHNQSVTAHDDIRVLVQGVRNDLVNYYLKQETYSREEVNAIVANISTISFEVVVNLPTSDIKTNIIYLMLKEGVAPDIYNEYIYVNQAWEIIGNTAIDLTNYVTIDSFNAFIANNEYAALSTTNKTVLGAINEVNSKPTGVYINGKTIENHVLGEGVDKGDLVMLDKTFNFDTAVILPSVQAVGGSTDCSFSPEGDYLAVAHTTTSTAIDGISVYKRDEDTFTKLSNIYFPSAIGRGKGCSFSHGGEYLAVSHEYSPYITIIKHNNDKFTKLNVVFTSIKNNNDCSFSPHGNYFAVIQNYEPFIIVYKRNGDTFTKLPDLEALTNGGNSCSFSHGGDYLAVAHYVAPCITVYNRNGDTFTKLSALEALPDVGNGCSFSPEGDYLAVIYGTSSTSHGLVVYKRNGDTFTKLPTLDRYYNFRACSFSPDGNYLVATRIESPYVSLYKRNGDTFTESPILGKLTSAGNGCSFSPEGDYLAVANSVTPYITVYENSNYLGDRIVHTLKRTKYSLSKGIALESGNKDETKPILITEKY